MEDNLKRAPEKHEVRSILSPGMSQYQHHLSTREAGNTCTDPQGQGYQTIVHQNRTRATKRKKQKEKKKKKLENCTDS